MKKLLLILACVSVLFCLFAFTVSADGVDPNAEYYDKVYTDTNGNEFPIYEKDGDTYYPLVWFAYEDEAGETKYVKVRFDDIGIYSLEPSQGRFNGCFYTHTDENGNEIELNTKNLLVLNLRAGVMAATYNKSKVKNGTNITVKTIETNRTDVFPSFSRLEAVYIPLSQVTVGSLNISSLRVCDIDKNQGAITIGNKAFQNSSIEELFIPGGSKIDGNSNFQGASKLKKLTFGAGFTASIPNYFFDRCTSLETICFMGSEGELNSLVIGTANNGAYKSLTTISYTAYSALEDKSGKYIIFDCSPCLAFYGDKHTPTEETVLVGNDYFGEIKVACPCGVDGCVATMTVSTIAPMFVDKGYSARLFGEGYAVTQSYLVNREAIKEYEKYAEVKFGVLAMVNFDGGAIVPDFTKDTVYSAELWDITTNDYLDIIVNNIPDNTEDVENGLADMKNSDRSIVFCIYATEGESVLFLDGGATLEAVTGISYQEILNRTEK